MPSIDDPILFEYLKDVDWPHPWIRIDDDGLAKELQRELCLGHPLYGCKCQAVAYSEEPNQYDDVIFLTNHPEYPIAFVHLTWKKETSPDFPFTFGYKTWDSFLAAQSV